MTAEGGGQVAYAPETPKAPDTRSRTWVPVAIALSTYFLLILTIWGPFAFCSGMPLETAFLYNSEKLPTSRALFYGDPLRPHTSTFYHLSYLLGEWIGWNGSFVPFQFVYAALWWARGALVFLILRKFFPGQALLCFAAGCFTIVHASDRALQWVGQLNQFGFMFWMLLGFYLLILALKQPRLRTAIPLLVLACFFEYMSLWSYEAQIFLIAAAPMTLLFRQAIFRRSWAPALFGWYAVLAVYLALSIQRYTGSTQPLYQTGVMRSDWSIAHLAADLGFDVYNSVGFWAWTWFGDASIRNERLALLVVVAVVCFWLGAIGCLRAAEREGGPSGALSVRAGLVLAGVGAVLLLLSFPVYLLLPRSLWRTQMLSGIPTALIYTAVLSLAIRGMRSRRTGAIAAIALGSIVIAYGSAIAIRRGSIHSTRWEKHRGVMEQILTAAPSVKGPVMILLTGIPKDGTPFAHNLWMDYAMRLAYPGEQVVGTYFYEDQSRAPGANMVIRGNRWVWDGTGDSPMIHEVPVSRTITMRYNAANGTVAIEKTSNPVVPADLLPTVLPPRELAGSTPARRAVNRYLAEFNCCSLVR